MRTVWAITVDLQTINKKIKNPAKPFQRADKNIGQSLTIKISKF